MWRTIGQTHAINLLESALKSGTLAHAYLFIGLKHIGKTTLAYDLAAAVNCQQIDPPCYICPSCQRIIKRTHSDVFYLGIENTFDSSKSEAKIKQEISIDDIRKLQQFAHLPPYEGRYKIFVIDDADRLSDESANCLLKTLEEPHPQIILILLAVDESNILPTIVSRCQRIYLNVIPNHTIEKILIDSYKIDMERAKVLARISEGRLGWAINSINDDAELEKRAQILSNIDILLTSTIDQRFDYVANIQDTRGNIEKLISTWLTWWTDLLLIKCNCNDDIINIDYLSIIEKWSNKLNLAEIKLFLNYLQYSLSLISKNANIRLVLENIMFNMPGTEMK